MAVDIFPQASPCGKDALLLTQDPRIQGSQNHDAHVPRTRTFALNLD